jgi:molybdate transport repressor ModE-like protein
MDIDLYRTFLAISETGSFTVAARHVGRTQSAVSQQIRRLEDTFGHPLFDRSGGEIALTEFGKSLLDYARSIVDTHAQALAHFNRATFDGLIVIGIPDAYLKRLMQRVIREFKALLPQATLNIVIDDSATLARRIADGSIDLSFVTEGSWPTHGPIAFRDRLVVIGPAEGDVHKADPLPIAVWDERNFDEGLLTDRLDKMGRGYRVANICRSVYGQHQAILAGHCVAALAESCLEEGERIYTAAEGFAPLKELVVRLERSRLKKSKVLDQLEAHLLACCVDV